MNKILLLGFMLLVTGTFLYGQSYQSTIDLRLSSDVQWTTINGKPTMYYELYITSYATDTIRLQKLNVTDKQNTSSFYSINVADWSKRAGRIGNFSSVDVLPPGGSEIIFLEYTLPRFPLTLLHELTMEIKGKTELISGAALTITKQKPVVLGAPLKGGPWAAVYHPDWQRGHRRVIYTIDGKARIPGRYAIDFILLDEQGHYTKGDENEINSWYGYGADVLAVKEGVVSSVKNDFAESTTLKHHSSYTADKATGNFISIDIGDGKFVFYEHLKPGSIRVQPGQKVKKGQVIASLGFTGQTTGPHLHFHLADANSPLGAEGVPFVFEEIKSLGRYDQFDDFGKRPWTPLNSDKETLLLKEHPAPNAVVRFE